VKNNDKWIRTCTKAVMENDKVTKIVGTFSDITEQKQAQINLKKLSTVVEQSPASIIITDLDGCIEYVNPIFTELTGFTQEEVIGKNANILKSGTLSKSFYTEMWDTISAGKVWRGELHNKKKNGKLYWEDATLSPVFDAEGKIVNYLAVKEDITEKKEALRSLQESETKYRIVSENTYHWEFWEREDGSFVYNSPSCERITGYTAEEFDADPTLLHAIIHPDDIKHYKVHIDKTWSKHGPDECNFRICTKNGDIRYIEHVCRPAYDGDNNFVGIRGTNIDVTDRKLIENKLLESEQRFRMIFETLPVISVQGYDHNRNVIYWNKASEIVYGYTKEEAMGGKLEDLIIPDQMKSFVINDIQNWIDKGIAIPSAELTLKRKNGEPIYVYSNHVMIDNPQGEKELYCIDVDLTDLKQAETELRESELYHRSLLLTIPDMVFVLDKNGTFLDFKSSSIEELLVMPIEFLNKNISEILPPGVTKKQLDAIEQSLNSKELVSFEYNLVLNHETKYFSASTVAFGDNRVIVTVRDITDYQNNLIRIKQLLAIEEKQNESLRNFTHIVSHNLRIHTANMLGILMVFEMEQPETYQNQFVQMLKETSENLEETIGHLNQVLNIKLNTKLELKEINLYLVTKKAISGVSIFAKEADVEIYNEVPESLNVRAFPAYLNAVFMSLLSNGVKYHSTERTSWVKITAIEETDYTVISVEDNGLGIDLKRHGSKVFDMYRKFHEGTDTKGLGLFIAKNQIEAMGGHIEAKSELNMGSTFKIYLPNENNK